MVRKSIQMQQQVRNKFIAADRDGDNRLSKEDLKWAFRELGAHVPEWRVFRSLKRIDAYKDGVMINTAGPEFEEIVKYAFSKYGDKIGK